MRSVSTASGSLPSCWVWPVPGTGCCANVGREGVSGGCPARPTARPLRPASRRRVKLVGRLTVGDRAAFGELYDRRVKPVYSLARASASTSDVVGDLTEDPAREVFPNLGHNPARYG